MTVADRIPLTRQRIADAALELIDTRGFDALSMRKLGAELQVEAMSLYNHVTNKADLLDAVADRLYGDVLVAYGDPIGDWKVHARALSHAYVNVAAAHPLALSLLISPATDSESAREFDARIVEAAELFSEDPRVGALAFSTLANWVIGTLVHQHGLVSGGTPLPDAMPDGGVVIPADERFREGLETVLMGIEARYSAG